MDPNFMWLGSEKRNAVSLVGAEKVGAFFTGNKRGLMLWYLRLFKSLTFRCFGSFGGRTGRCARHPGRAQTPHMTMKSNPCSVVTTWMR